MKKTNSSLERPAPKSLSQRAKRDIRILSAAVAVSFACANIAHAVDATWTSNASGTWSTGSNWDGGMPADGAGYTATFASASGNPAITVSTSSTIGNLTFSTSGQSYSLAGSGTLTLDGASASTIQVDGGVAASIGGSLVLAGTSNLVKTGEGTLTLSTNNTANTYTGKVTISNGGLTLGATNALKGVSVILDSSEHNVSLNSFSNIDISIGSVTVAAGGTGTATIYYNVLNSRNFTTSLILNKALTMCMDTAGLGYVLSGQISGTGNMIVTGGGRIDITGNSNGGWSGGMTISKGTVRIYGNSSSAGTGTIVLGDGNTGASSVAVQFGQNFTTSNAIWFTNNGTGSASIGDVNGFGTGNTLTGSIRLDRSIGVSLTGTISGIISGTGGIAYSGATVVTGNNTYTGTNTVTGTLRVTKIADGGSASSLGMSSSDASNLIINGGTFAYGGSGANTNRLFTVGSSGAIVASSGNGGLFFTNTGALEMSGTGNRILTLTGTYSGVSVLAPRIVDPTGGGVTSLTKSGTANWVLANNNTYTGSTTVNGGKLTLLGSNKTSSLSVSGSATFNYVPSANLQALVLSTASGNALTLADGSVLGVGIGGAGTDAATITVGAGTGVASASGAIKMNVYGVNTVTPGTSFTLVSSANGGLTSGGATYSLGTVFNNTNFKISTVSASDTAITVTPTAADAITAAYWRGGYAAMNNVWAASDGSTTSNWTTDAAGTVNTGVVPGENADVYFSATGAANQGTTYLGYDMSIRSLTINSASAVGLYGDGSTLTVGEGNILVNTAAAVTLGAKIAGVANLTKNGTGVLTLTGLNSFAGPITIYSGAVSTNYMTDGGVDGGLGGSSSASENLVLTGGTLQYTGAAASSNRLFSVGTGGGTIDASGSGALNLTGTDSIGFNGQTGARTLRLIGTNTGANTLAALIGDYGGATALTKTAGGTWVLTNANTYTGVTLVAGGILSVSKIGNGGDAGNLGAATNAAANLVLASGTLQYTGAGESTDRLFSTGTGGMAIDASGSGALKFTNTGSMGFYSQTGTRVVRLLGTNTDANTLAAVIGDNGGVTTFVKEGIGTWALSGLNTYTGVTHVRGGILRIDILNNGGVASNIGKASSANTNLILNGGTLQYTGAATSSDRLFSVGTSGGAIDASGSGALSLTNTGTIGYYSQTGARTLTLTGANTGNNTLAASIGNNSGATTVAKAGTGTWVLSGTSNYTGATNVTGGKLVVSGSLTGTTAVNVASGATLTVNGYVNTGAIATVNGTLRGNGQLGAATLVGGTINAGDDVIGMLTTADISLDAVSHLAIDFGRSVSGGGDILNDKINVLGGVTLASGADIGLSLGSGLFNLKMGDILYIVVNDGSDAVNGVFTKLNNADAVLTEGSVFSYNSQNYQITYAANAEGDAFSGGNDIALMVVPEPSTWAMIAGGCGMLLGIQRLRKGRMGI